MPLRRREPNCGPPNIRMLQTTEGERGTYKERVETRQLAGGKCDLVHKRIKHFIQFANSIDFEKLLTH
jgi:hypothetical protein